MGNSQRYIGSPGGVVVCVDRLQDKEMEGRFYSRYLERQVRFWNADQLTGRMNRLLDGIGFPHATTVMRTFGEEGPRGAEHRERMRVMTDKELLKQHGELGTFVVRVQHRQHSSWQGKITWMEENRSLYFRSAWEMVKLMESALNTRMSPEELEKEQDWFADSDPDGTALK